MFCTCLAIFVIFIYLSIIYITDICYGYRVGYKGRCAKFWLQLGSHSTLNDAVCACYYTRSYARRKWYSKQFREEISMYRLLLHAVMSERTGFQPFGFC